jgi:adenylate kinase
VSAIEPVNLVLLGPPGAGKGTQAALLQNELSLRYLSSGNLLRGHRSESTALGRMAAEYIDDGALVPDELVIEMLMPALRGSPHGFLLDGFPRTVAQAHALDSRLSEAGTSVRAVVLVDAPDDVIVRRISGRYTCPRGHVYHLESSRPARAGVCDRDGERLSRRTDDEPETVRRRLIAYHEMTEPLAGFYEQRGILLRVDGDQPAAAVFEAIRAGLAAAPADLRTSPGK